MLTIKNYKLGEGAHFLGWELNSVTETNESYCFLWTDLGVKKSMSGVHQYQIILSRRISTQLNPNGDLDMWMFTTTPGTQPIWSGFVNRLVLEYHWEWIDKMIRVMNQYKPYR
jgi:hypothetical protein